MSRPRRQLDPARVTDNRAGRAVRVQPAALVALFPELEQFIQRRRRAQAAAKTETSR